MNTTFKSIEKHLEKVDFDQLENEYKANSGKRARGGIPEQLCAVFQAIKPILEAIKKIPFIPEKWVKGIALLITILDGICAI